MREESIEVGSIWRHFKRAKAHRKCLCRSVGDWSELVVYTHDGDIWARPIEMFLSNEDISSRIDNTTKQKYRFERI